MTNLFLNAKIFMGEKHNSQSHSFIPLIFIKCYQVPVTELGVRHREKRQIQLHENHQVYLKSTQILTPKILNKHTHTYHTHTQNSWYV